MNKELIDRAWRVLPTEFKEEVKKEWQDVNNVGRLTHDVFLVGCHSTMKLLFGIHNLTSDAEGEEEMLRVSRKKVQGLYDLVYEIYADGTKEWYQGYMKAMQDLFGSKCLPDEEPLFSNQPENYNNKNLIVANDNKPTEPKFKMGDTASYVCSPTLKHKCTVTKVMQNGHSGKWEYNVIFEWGKPGMWIPESDLEPCTSQYPIPPESGELKPQTAETQLKEERTEPTCTDDCPSPRPSQHFDDIINRSFADHNRLHIAAMLAAGMLANDVRCYPIDRALELADKLITACKKGGQDA